MNEFNSGDRVMFSVKDGDTTIDCRGTIINDEGDDLTIIIDTKFIGQSEYPHFEEISFPRTIAKKYLVLLGSGEDRKSCNVIE